MHAYIRVRVHARARVCVASFNSIGIVKWVWHFRNSRWHIAEQAVVHVNVGFIWLAHVSQKQHFPPYREGGPGGHSDGNGGVWVMRLQEEGLWSVWHAGGLAAHFP